MKQIASIFCNVSFAGQYIWDNHHNFSMGGRIVSRIMCHKNTKTLTLFDDTLCRFKEFLD